MQRFHHFFVRAFSIFCVLLLVACSTTPNPPSDNSVNPTDTTEEEDTTPETKNVFYRGTIEPAGISIYQEGTHKLSLPDGRFILLESSAIDLNGYVGEEVEIFGSLRPTVEEGGMIMRVDKAVALVEEEDEDTDAEEDTEVDPRERLSNTSDSGSIETVVIESGTDADTDDAPDIDERKSEGTTSVDTSKEDTLVEASSSSLDPAVLAARVEKMAAQEYEPEHWTLEYCSSHIGFCIPVHKYYWYKSFGATDEDLWHVELGIDQVETVGDGPLVLQLLPGDLPAGAVSRTVATKDGNAIGYVSWKKGYFVISAPEKLLNAVQYIVTHLKENEEVAEDEA